MRTDSATEPRVEGRQSKQVLPVLVVDDARDTDTTQKTILESESHPVEGAPTRDEVPPPARSFRRNAVILVWGYAHSGVVSLQ